MGVRIVLAHIGSSMQQWVACSGLVGVALVKQLNFWLVLDLLIGGPSASKDLADPS